MQRNCTQGEHHVKVKVKIGAMLLQARSCQRLPTKHQKLGERPGTDLSSQPLAGTNPANTLISDI